MRAYQFTQRDAELTGRAQSHAQYIGSYFWSCDREIDHPDQVFTDLTGQTDNAIKDGVCGPLDADRAPVMQHDSHGHGSPCTQTAREWFGEPIIIGDALTSEQADQLSGYAAVRIDNDMDTLAAAYLVDDANGWTMHVYAIDPLALSAAE